MQISMKGKSVEEITALFLKIQTQGKKSAKQPSKKSGTAEESPNETISISARKTPSKVLARDLVENPRKRPTRATTDTPKKSQATKQVRTPSKRQARGGIDSRDKGLAVVKAVTLSKPSISDRSETNRNRQRQGEFAVNSGKLQTKDRADTPSKRHTRGAACTPSKQRTEVPVETQGKRITRSTAENRNKREIEAKAIDEKEIEYVHDCIIHCFVFLVNIILTL